MFSFLIILVLLQYRFDSIESFFYDKRILSDPSINKIKKSSVVLVIIDEESDSFLGEKYPYSYATFTKFINKIKIEKPRAIGQVLKLPYPENHEEHFQLKNYYESINEYISYGGHFKFGSILDSKGEQLPPLELKNLGYLSSIIVEDTQLFPNNKAVRKAILNIEGEETFQLWLANEMRNVWNKKHLTFDQVHYNFYLPDISAVATLIKFPDVFESSKLIERISFYRVIVGAYSEGFFKDKIVILGQNYRGVLGNLLKTPYTSDPKDFRSSIFINVAIALGLANQWTVKEIPFVFTCILSLLFTLYLSIMTFKLNPISALRNIFVIVVFIIIFSFVIFWIFGYWIYISHLILTCFVVYYVCVPIRAVTEYRSRFEIENRSKMQKELNHLKNNFISLMSHDLKTPVAKLVGILELLQNRLYGDHESLKYIHEATKSTNELNSFINSILEVSQLDKNSLKLNKKSKDINVLISQVLSEVEYVAKKKEIKINTDLGPLFPIQLDITLIKRVISNLVENAIKYGAIKGFVNIRSYESKKWVIFEVEDNGPGISEENTPFIFDKFYRVKNDANHSIKGSGLGLYLVKFFVELHEGEIEYIKNTLNGATFKVKLPNIE